MAAHVRIEFGPDVGILVCKSPDNLKLHDGHKYVYVYAVVMKPENATTILPEDVAQKARLAELASILSSQRE